jgi:hypothetical protein
LFDSISILVQKISLNTNFIQ